MSPIIYLEKSFRDQQSIFNELRWMMTARAKGETYNPQKIHRPKGARHALVAITWETLCHDAPLPDMGELIRSIRNRPVKRESDRPVSTRDGKPIGWYVAR